MGRFDSSPQDAAWCREHARQHRGRRLALPVGLLLLVFGGGALLRSVGSPGWGRVVLVLLEFIVMVASTVVAWRWFRKSLAHNDPYLRERHPHWDDTGPKQNLGSDASDGHE